MVTHIAKMRYTKNLLLMDECFLLVREAREIGGRPKSLRCKNIFLQMKKLRFVQLERSMYRQVPLSIPSKRGWVSVLVYWRLMTRGADICVEPEFPSTETV